MPYEWSDKTKSFMLNSFMKKRKNQWFFFLYFNQNYWVIKFAVIFFRPCSVWLLVIYPCFCLFSARNTYTWSIVLSLLPNGYQYIFNVSREERSSFSLRLILFAEDQFDYEIFFMRTKDKIDILTIQLIYIMYIDYIFSHKNKTKSGLLLLWQI